MTKEIKKSICFMCKKSFIKGNHKTPQCNRCIKKAKKWNNLKHISHRW